MEKFLLSLHLLQNSVKIIAPIFLQHLYYLLQHLLFYKSHKSSQKQPKIFTWRKQNRFSNIPNPFRINFENRTDFPTFQICFESISTSNYQISVFSTLYSQISDIDNNITHPIFRFSLIIKQYQKHSTIQHQQITSAIPLVKLLKRSQNQPIETTGPPSLRINTSKSIVAKFVHQTIQLKNWEMCGNMIYL